jgi:hypothetical protein
MKQTQGGGSLKAEDIRSIAALFRGRNPRQTLAPMSPWDGGLSERFKAAGLNSSPDALALQAGLLLWNDDLDASHTVSQDVETQTGSYWHGIMHRMEGDYSNAKYWFRRVGSHPVYAQVAEKAAVRLKEAADNKAMQDGYGTDRLIASIVDGSGAWNPYAFIDCVERAVTARRTDASSAPYTEVLERIQQDEIEALLSYCFRQVFGGTLFEHSVE